MVSTLMLGGDALFILFERNDENNGMTQTQLEEDMPRGMSMPMCEARRQEKKPEWSMTEHPYAWWKHILIRVQASGPGAGYTMNDWNMMVMMARNGSTNRRNQNAGRESTRAVAPDEIHGVGMEGVPRPSRGRDGKRR